MPNMINAFWFGLHASDAAVAQEKSGLWWGKDPQADQEIRQRFEAWTDKAANRELDSWAGDAAGCLALILLTDQFPRNMYRDTPQACLANRPPGLIRHRQNDEPFSCRNASSSGRDARPSILLR